MLKLKTPVKSYMTGPLFNLKLSEMDIFYKQFTYQVKPEFSNGSGVEFVSHFGEFERIFKVDRNVTTPLFLVGDLL